MQCLQQRIKTSSSLFIQYERLGWKFLLIKIRQINVQSMPCLQIEI